jgi:Murein endopeptidase
MKNFIRRFAPVAVPVALVAVIAAGVSMLAGSPDARKLFAAKSQPAALPTESIGGYTNGCIAGANQLPLDGPHHQVVRPSRNRYWSHPRTIEALGKIGARAAQEGYNGLLIGDMSMPRGGPMPYGHASHASGLDVDIWLVPMPDRKLTDVERETMPFPSVLKIDSAELDPNVWTEAHANMVRAAAQTDNVARVFATPAIKKNLCQKKDANGKDSWWLARIRPCKAGVCGGHDDHIHVRIKCAPGDKNCANQSDPDPSVDGCGKELDDAMAEAASDPPYSSKPALAAASKPPFPLSKMPKQCTGVLNAKP